MSSRDTALAVLLRKAEWLLDEAAFEVGGGRYSDQQRRELATALDELSAALQESIDEAAPTVIEVEQRRDSGGYVTAMRGVSPTTRQYPATRDTARPVAATVADDVCEYHGHDDSLISTRPSSRSSSTGTASVRPSYGRPPRKR